MDATQKAERLLPDVELNGVDVARWRWVRPGAAIRKQSRDKCPLFVAGTNAGQEEDRQRTAEAGVTLHLVKLIEPGILWPGVLQRFAQFLRANR